MSTNPKATTQITELSQERRKNGIISNSSVIQKQIEKRGRKETKTRWDKEQDKRLKPNHIDDHIKRLMEINRQKNK